MIQPQYSQQQYPQAPSAVSINIYEPKSYGSAPQGQAQAPYSYANPMYNMPQASAWGTQPMGVQSPYQQYMPANIMPQYPVMPQYQQAPQIMPVAPQVMPQSAIEQPQQAEQTAQTEQTPMPEVKQGEQGPKVNTDALVQDLKSEDVNMQAEAITSIANFTQLSPDVAFQVDNDTVKQGLIDIINKDTSALPAATEEQKALEEKEKKGEKLTPEEQAKKDQLSPKLAAEKNKIFSMFTLAMIQKLSRDNKEQYDQFRAEQGQNVTQPLGLKDLMGYNEITNIITNEPNKELKMAAIQALQHMAKPEEKEEVSAILKPIIDGQDADLKQTAQDAIAKLGDAAAPAQQQPAASADAAQAAPAPAEAQPQQVDQAAQEQQKAA